MRTIGCLPTVLLLVGCSAFRPMTPEETAALIRTNAMTATALGLQHGINDQAERAKVAEQIATFASNGLGFLDGGPPSAEQITALLAAVVSPEIPIEVRVSIQGAVDLLLAKLTLPEVDDRTVLYVRAFLEGVGDGARAVI